MLYHLGLLKVYFDDKTLEALVNCDGETRSRWNSTDSTMRKHHHHHHYHCYHQLICLVNCRLQLPSSVDCSAKITTSRSLSFLDVVQSRRVTHALTSASLFTQILVIETRVSSSLSACLCSFVNRGRI